VIVIRPDARSTLDKPRPGEIEEAVERAVARA